MNCNVYKLLSLIISCALVVPNVQAMKRKDPTPPTAAGGSAGPAVASAASSASGPSAAGAAAAPPVLVGAVAGSAAAMAGGAGAGPADSASEVQPTQPKISRTGAAGRALVGDDSAGPVSGTEAPAVVAVGPAAARAGSRAQSAAAAAAAASAPMPARSEDRAAGSGNNDITGEEKDEGASGDDLPTSRAAASGAAPAKTKGESKEERGDGPAATASAGEIINLSELIAQPTILVTNGEDDFVPRSISTKDLILSSDMLCTIFSSSLNQEYAVKAELDENEVIQITRNPESKEIMLVLSFETQTLTDLLDTMILYRSLVEGRNNYKELYKELRIKGKRINYIHALACQMSQDRYYKGTKVMTPSQRKNLLLAADYLQMPEITSAIVMVYSRYCIDKLIQAIDMINPSQPVSVRASSYLYEAAVNREYERVVKLQTRHVITTFISECFPLLTHLVEKFRRNLVYEATINSVSNFRNLYDIRGGIHAKYKYLADEVCNGINISPIELGEDCFIDQKICREVDVKKIAQAYLEQGDTGLCPFYNSTMSTTPSLDAFSMPITSFFLAHPLIKAIVEKVDHHVNELTMERMTHPDFDFVEWFNKLPMHPAHVEVRNKIKDKIEASAKSFLDRYPLHKHVHTEAALLHNQTQLINMKAAFITLPEGIFKNYIRLLNYERRTGLSGTEPHAYAEPLDRLESNFMGILIGMNVHCNERKKWPSGDHRDFFLKAANELYRSHTFDFSNLDATLNELNGLLDLIIMLKSDNCYDIHQSCYIYTAISVKKLKLSNNRLDKIPQKIFTLFPELKELDLSNNQIKSIECIELCKKLEKLNISNNQLEDISPVCKLKKLTALDFRNNPYLQRLPWELANLEHLTVKHFDAHLRWPSKAVILWTPPARSSSSPAAEVKETKE